MPRLDALVTKSGLAESRQRAQALILAGKVRVAGETVRSPEAIAAALSRFRDSCRSIGYAVKAEAPSEVTGAEGNREIFVQLRPEKL